MTNPAFPSATFCADLRSHSPTWVTDTDCVSSYLNIVLSTILFSQFLRLLNKLVANNRRALAGYTKNTVSIDIHIKILEGAILWTVVWGLYCYLGIDDSGIPDGDNSDDSLGCPSRFTIAMDALVYSLSCFFETVVMFLLSSSSIGVNAFRKSYVISFCISLTLLVAFVLTAIFCTPEHPNIQINNLIATRYILTSMLYMSGYVYSIHNAPARHAIVRYVCFIVPVSLFKAAGRYMMASGVDAGYCVYDVGRAINYIGFPSIVYIALKRDSQYWTEDITKDDYASSHFIDDTTKQELPNYADVVIPKSELYFYSKLTGERPDGSLQLHVWRRKIVCVKVFEMDYLTRDNITGFKFEANAMRRLSHENIVRFLGVVIDPPGMGIVMEYCCNGDLYSVLERLREKVDRDRTKKKATRLDRQDGRTPSSVLYDALDSDDSEGPNTDSISDMGFLKDDKPRPKFSPFRVLKQVARGMRYLHSSDGGRHAHRDLKSLNILLDENWESKIADFGECMNITGVSSDANGIIGTPAWAAPEVLNHDKVSLASDVFSFAIVMWEMLTWQPPFIHLPQREMEREFKRENLQLIRVIGNVFGVNGGGRERKQKVVKRIVGTVGRKKGKGGGGSRRGKDKLNQSWSEDSGSRRRTKTDGGGIYDALLDEESVNDLRQSLLSGGRSEKHSEGDVWSSVNSVRGEVDVSMDDGMGWGGGIGGGRGKGTMGGQHQDDMRVLKSKKQKEEVIVFRCEMEDEEQSRVLIAEKMYRPPLVLAPRSLVDLMQRCWSQDPNLRPTFVDIVAELESIKEKEEGELDAQFPFEIANLVNYAADTVSSPLPPKPHKRGGEMYAGGGGGGGSARNSLGVWGDRTPRSSEGGGGGKEGMMSMPASPTQQRIYSKDVLDVGGR